MDKVRRRPREDARDVDENDPLAADDRTRVSRRRRRRRGRPTGRSRAHRVLWGFPDDRTMDRSTPTTTRTTRRPSETTDERDPSTRTAGYRHRRQGSPLRSIGLDRRQAIVARPTRGASMRRDDDRRRAWACTRDARARVSCRGGCACARARHARVVDGDGRRGRGARRGDAMRGARAG